MCFNRVAVNLDAAIMLMLSFGNRWLVFKLVEVYIQSVYDSKGKMSLFQVLH